jgi:phosphatidylglycerophosphate synthase
MLDRFLIGPVQRILDRPARMLVRHGIGADGITLFGFGVGLLALPALAAGAFGLALGLILANRVFDGLDGMVARLTRPSDRGAFLDIALDFFFYATVPFGFALHDPAVNALPAAALVVAFVGTGSSFLAFAVIAAKAGLSNAHYPAKGIYFLGGLTEGTETIVFFVVICLWPELFPVAATIFAGLCLLTTLFRWYWGWTRLPA